MSPPSLEIAIFSYNRGPWLAQCVASARSALPFARLRVHDDGSDDPATREELEALGEAVVGHSGAGRARHGGLYANMQRALEMAEAEHLLFMQDDMQVVRPLLAADREEIGAIFGAFPRAAFLAPTFMKGNRRRRHTTRLMAHARRRAYHARPDQPARKMPAYHDTALAHVGRLRAAGWRFAGSEADCAARARALFGEMPWMGDPFTFYAPEVPVHRGRRRGLAGRLAARLGPDEPISFEIMDSDTAHRFRARPLGDWPVAEDHLTPTDPATRRPFVYKNVKRRWWLNALDKADRALRRA